MYLDCLVVQPRGLTLRSCLDRGGLVFVRKAGFCCKDALCPALEGVSTQDVGMAVRVTVQSELDAPLKLLYGLLEVGNGLLTASPLSALL